MITREQALALLRTDPVASAHLMCEFSEGIDRLNVDFAELKERNDVLGSECRALRDENRLLKEQPAKNSRNSSKPPSSDGYKKPAPKSLRKPGDRPSGGQKGHKGRTLRMVEKPDKVVPHTVEQCERCGSSLADRAPDRVEQRQVFDIPEPELEVTEHRAEIKTCSCGHVNRASFPEAVKGPVQYGPSIRSVAAYLRDYQLLPSARLTEVMRDLFGAETFSEGTPATIAGECFAGLEPVDEAIRLQATEAPVAGFDETGMRADGALHWLHTVSTDLLTWLFAHPKRGGDAMDAAGVLPEFRGRAIHDFWHPYLKYDCLHGFCNAHLLRELTFLHEELDQCWAADMIDQLMRIKDAVDAAKQAGDAVLADADLDRFQARYFRMVTEGYDENPLPKKPPPKKRKGRRKQTKARNLLDRFRDHGGEILAFMYDFAVPFDNNLSERDLRMAKLKQKISGTFRTTEGLTAFCRSRSYIATARKNGLSAFDALRRVFEGTPFVPSPPLRT